MNEEAARITATKAELDEKEAKLNKMKANAEALKAARQKELNQLKKDEKRSDTLIATLKKDKNKYQKQLATKQKQVEALNREIEKIIASYIAQQNAASKDSGKAGTKQKPIDHKLAADFEKNKGKLPWPAEGPVVEKFGKHNHPVYTSIVMPFNNGINIALSPGTQIKQVRTGTTRQLFYVLLQIGGSRSKSWRQSQNRPSDRHRGHDRPSDSATLPGMERENPSESGKLAKITRA